MKKSIESYQLECLLKRVTKFGYERPSNIADHERPDFVLTISGQRVGVEVTEAVYQEYKRAEKLRVKVCPTQCIVTTHLQDREQRRSDDELISDMLNLNSAWKDAEQEMCDWREKVASSLERKRAKLGQAGFQLFDQNWLLIYDEPGLSEDIFHYDRACRYAAALFSAPFAARDFDTVFLLSEQYLFRWHKQELSLHYEHRNV